ncbi:hypothetical protein [Amycolatopsis sp. FDAARGOS 1241]|uniref:hypothetical protein n=1 Tax=Amycolatopsis sp. FDAARGOS 1241 TaxID=2778070 RepID=UPI0019501806|nr:hypothetical protein [Amycolatopsis sp. FDAARGOS 1241]QRP47075.1 hypothetical protein I6J71_03350 [Amycolatopsis sp. FDAARGOS 1241]
MVIALAPVIVMGAGGAGLAGGAGTTTEGLAGNTAGDVGDGLPGRDLSVREAEEKKSAQRGRKDETWSRLALKQLKREVRDEIKQAQCAATATDRVREFLLKTPCTSMKRIVFPLGDGHGNAVVVSVVWVGFRTRAQTEAFERVESRQGAGDVKPLGAAALGLAGVSFTG